MAQYHNRNAKMNAVSSTEMDNILNTNINCILDTNARMDASERRALPEVLDMAAEYENSPQYLEDSLQHALLHHRRAPRTRAASSPRRPPVLDMEMSMDIDDLDIGAPAFNTVTATTSTVFAGPAGLATHTVTTPAAGTAATATNPPPEPRCMSPMMKIHSRDAHTKPRPTPSTNNPWYAENLDTRATEDHMFIILKSVLMSTRRWNLEFSPENFRAFARKARTNWHTTNPELYKMSSGLREMHEFLVCGPKDFTLSHALSTKSFEMLHDVVDDIVPHLMALIKLEGCGWLDEQVRSPLMGIDQELFVLLEESRAYRDERWNALPMAEKLPYQMGDMAMGGT